MRTHQFFSKAALLLAAGFVFAASPMTTFAQESGQAPTSEEKAEQPPAGNTEPEEIAQTGTDEPKPAEGEKPTESPAESDKPEEKSEPPKPATPPKPAEPVKLPKLGSADTPLLPGQPWRVHDFLRPRPKKVAPPEGTITTPAPGDAIVLFDGSEMSAWAHHDREDMATFYEPQWKVQDGYFEITRGHGDLYTIENFADLQLHIEWQIPENVRGSSQGRGNSGIKFLGLYEVQILDSYNNLTYADGQAAAIYGQYPPAVNASRKPGEWQTYDIIFEMPRFDGEKMTSPGYLTVLHNGVLVHHRRELAGVTGMASPGRYRPHPPAGPIMLQDHGNPIRFRNVWARHLDK